MDIGINQKSNQQMPTSRRAGIVVKKLDNEILIYDTDRHQAHCLDKNATLIWENCDGNHSVKDLSRLLNPSKEISEQQKEQMVWLALDQLEKSNLLEGPMAKPESMKGLTRRQLMKTAGIVALIAVPIVSTLVAPTAAQASTCLASGQGCGVSAQCCSGLCSVGACV